MCMHRIIISMLGLFALVQTSQAQRFSLFSQEMKTDYPSVVYDFLERYLYEIDSLQSRGAYITQRLHDDKFTFLIGSASTARKITPELPFAISKTDDKFYEVSWCDTLNNVLLDVVFPMQYELLLGKPKVEIEKDFRTVLHDAPVFVAKGKDSDSLIVLDDGCLMTQPVSNYYVESLNTATYYVKSVSGDTIPVFSEKDKWHSSANLFQGCIDDIANYTLYIEQNLYGFNTSKYAIQLQQWLGYCQAMKLNTYFAIEEEREDGLKALLIAQSQDLGFNHMLSIIIPDNFVTNKKAVLKATLNAYIPTQNVKDLYQQYVKKPKKKI